MTGWVLFVFCIGLAVTLVGMVGGAFLNGRRRQRRTTGCPGWAAA